MHPSPHSRTYPKHTALNKPDGLYDPHSQNTPNSKYK
jgi:hypothetical protein